MKIYFVANVDSSTTVRIVLNNERYVDIPGIILVDKSPYLGSQIDEELEEKLFNWFRTNRKK